MKKGTIIKGYALESKKPFDEGNFIHRVQSVGKEGNCPDKSKAMSDIPKEWMERRIGIWQVEIKLIKKVRL